MAITVNAVKCPSCGADLPVEEGREKIFCSFCGTPIVITNENEHIYRHIDEAGIKQAETDRMVRMRELDLEEKKAFETNGMQKTLIMIWLALSLVILAICIFKWAIQDDFATGFLMLVYMGGPVIGGGAYLIFKLLPEKQNEKTMKLNGGIRFPKGLEPFSEKNVEHVANALKSVGFYNIECVNMHDLTIGLLQKPGKIDSITVNGERITSGGKIYMPEAYIVITYHGK